MENESPEPGSPHGHGVRSLIISSSLTAARSIEAITFAARPGKIYLPAPEVAEELKWQFRTHKKGITLNWKKPTGLHWLLDGTPLVTTDELLRLGASIENDGEQLHVRARHGDFTVSTGTKWVAVNLALQRLTAWQGMRLVMASRISSGRHDSTPAGRFTAGPYKARTHYSSRDDNAPMPWSVQVTGNIFIHGFTSIPEYPASHGCIRLPLTGGNPARFLYDWVDIGTPVTVTRGK